MDRNLKRGFSPPGGRSFRIMSAFHWKNGYLGAFDTTAGSITSGWAGDPGPSTAANGNPFNAGDGLGSAASATGTAAPGAPELRTLANFSAGAYPSGDPLIDAAGDLFGETGDGGASGDGEVFELVATGSHFAHPKTVLVSFDGADGQGPGGGLITDSAGDLFGTTNGGGANGDGTVFEIVKTPDGYASTPTTLVSFTGADGLGPIGGLVADSAGDLFGVTAGVGGTLYEIVKTGDGYANAPTTLVTFKGADGSTPFANLMIDAAGDLFGTTNSGGANGDGTVFELVNTKHGYEKAPTTLVSFSGADGASPASGLVMDAAGDLFGMTPFGGANGDGEVFEIVKTEGGYAGAPTILYSFTSAIGSALQGNLIIDAAGNLFGTTRLGGTSDDGTAFELAKTDSGYASAPTILADFTGADGALPFGVVADANGTLFGATGEGGAKGDGTVFKIIDSGFLPPTAPAGGAIAASSPPHAAFAQAMAGFEPGRSGVVGPTILASRHEAATVLARPQIA